MSPEQEYPLSTVEGLAQPLPVEASLRGSVLVLIQFDVCEEIKLDSLQQIFGARTVTQPNFKHPAPALRREKRTPTFIPGGQPSTGTNVPLTS